MQKRNPSGPQAERAPRKAFVPPKLEPHQRLPQITGFSFPDDGWDGED